ncbi:MAG: FAD-dependent oxidoreductase [Candidatus Brocadiia bacterium]
MFDPHACYDVAVLGGGLCGFAAARRLAATGAHVALIEPRPVLGWETTWALHLELGQPGCETARWLAEAMEAAGGCRDGLLDAPIAEMVLDREADRSGIDLLLYAQPVAAATDGERLTGVLLGTKAGELPVRARAFADATENALAWRLAGGQAEPPADVLARHALMLNAVPRGAVPQPLELGDLGEAAAVRVRPSLWPGELLVSFGIPRPDVAAARLALPGLLRALHERLPALEGTLVSIVGHEPYPLAAWRADLEEGAAANLFAAGPWGAAQPPEEPLDVSQRLGIGEAAGEAVAAALDSLPAPGGEAALAHSTVEPPAREADVVVCGGGTAGAFAAIAAGRQGATTLLLEQSTCLGGIGTGGGIHSYYHGVQGGLQDEADARLAALEPLFGPARGFHPEAKKVVLEQMAREGGVQVVYRTTATGARAEELEISLPAPADHSAQPVRRLRAVVAAGPEGNAVYRAKAFVDATGDGDLAAMAGATFTLGRAADGLPHAYSLAAGRLGEGGQLLITNFDAGYCDPTDAVDLTRARRRALGHYWRERFDAASRLLYVAPILGLRNSRQIVGDACITLADEIAGRQFPDVVAYAVSHFDNHGFDYENESDEAMLWVWLLGNWRRPIGCEVPYRALLPVGVEGLLVGCRALSMSHDAHNQLRMQRDLQRVGEAAGVAAALAAAHGVTPRQLEVEEVQAALLETGALGPREQPRLPEPDARRLHDPSWAPAQPPARPVDQRAAELGTESGQEATWDLIRRGEEALPALLEATRTEKPATRFWASVALAMLGRDEAAPELRACLAERRDAVPEGRKTAPLWHAAAVLLGRIGDRQAVPELCRVVEEPETPLDARIAAIRALGRIGDPAAVPALEKCVERDDLPAERVLQDSGSGLPSVREDARWQVDLAAAEALARLGSPAPQVARRHADDERACVRRYARRVLGLGQS